MRTLIQFIILISLLTNLPPSILSASIENELEPYQCMQEQTFFELQSLLNSKSVANHCPNGHFCDDPFEREKWKYDSTESIIYFKLYFTIVREDDSTNPAITEEVLAQQVQQLNDDFLPYGFQFEYDWRFYESSTFRVFSAPNFFALDVMRHLLYVSPETQYNVIVTTLTNPGNSFTTNPTLFDPQGYSSGSVMSTAGAQFSNDLSRHVFTHEIGHIFGLIHTYWGYSEIKTCQGHCVENLASGSSDYAGDRCSDTPPERWWGGETFAGAGIDSCSEQPWPVYPNKNHMNISIYGDGKFYTPQQVARMYCYMDDYWQHIITGVTMSADITFGKAPLTVNFSAESDKTVTDWNWDFGDGNYANTQNSQNDYLNPGFYTVESVIQSAEGEYNVKKTGFIAVHDDSLIVKSVASQAGDTVLLPIYLHNFVPVSSLNIPIVTSGNVDLNYQGIVLEGSRNSDGTATLINYDGFNKRFTIRIDAPAGESISPDTGVVAFVKLVVPEGEADSMFLSIETYSTNELVAEYFENLYTPSTVAGYLHRLGCCTNIRGNVDDDNLDIVDISDLVYLVDFMFTSGQAPACPEEANIDGDVNELIDISDLVSLVDFMFTGGASPASCP